MQHFHLFIGFLEPFFLLLLARFDVFDFLDLFRYLDGLRFKRL